ncbi:MAG: Unknown protein [uncultured Sulfurovum sp.]|uniref:NADH-ubiquinone oxidoreductase chain E (EC) n=1 Tax=uncultured Sulfurovum sp. TaxID=269237 RepID=A0A6S6TRR6_9BACT|nr:MAG: Unknown protein [uncultured Sulfurovum sp.]
MGYLLAEIVLYLLGAGVIGFTFGWIVRDSIFKRDKLGNISSEKKLTEKESVSSAVNPLKSNSMDTDEALENVEEIRKPLLFTEVPIEGIDKLSLIKGIGPVLEQTLNDLGIYTFAQIASWDAKEEAWIGTQMAFPKRVTKEEWVKQAKELMNEMKS